MSRLSSEMRASLLEYGYKTSRVDNFTSATRVFHDLGIYGEAFDNLYEALGKHYRQPLGLIPAEFIPAEFSKAGRWRWIWLFGIRPFCNDIPELTLLDLERFILQDLSKEPIAKGVRSGL